MTTTGTANFAVTPELAAVYAAVEDAARVAVRDQVQLGRVPTAEGAIHLAHGHLRHICHVCRQQEAPALNVEAAIGIQADGADGVDAQARTFGHVDPFSVGHDPGRSNGAGSSTAGDGTP